MKINFANFSHTTAIHLLKKKYRHNRQRVFSWRKWFSGEIQHFLKERKIHAFTAFHFWSWHKVDVHNYFGFRGLRFSDVFNSNVACGAKWFLLKVEISFICNSKTGEWNLTAVSIFVKLYSVDLKNITKNTNRQVASIYHLMFSYLSFHVKNPCFHLLIAFKWVLWIGSGTVFQRLENN